jgi:hypothetical protein
MIARTKRSPIIDEMTLCSLPGRCAPSRIATVPRPSSEHNPKYVVTLWAIPATPNPEVETRRARTAFVANAAKRQNAADVLRLAKFQKMVLAREGVTVSFESS